MEYGDYKDKGPRDGGHDGPKRDYKDKGPRDGGHDGPKRDYKDKGSSYEHKKTNFDP